MTIEKAIKILDPENRKNQSKELVDEACRMAIEELEKKSRIVPCDLDTLEPGRNYWCVTHWGYGTDTRIIRYEGRRGEVVQFDRGFRVRTAYGKEWYLFPIDCLRVRLDFADER